MELNKFLVWFTADENVKKYISWESLKLQPPVTNLHKHGVYITFEEQASDCSHYKEKTAAKGP